MLGMVGSSESIPYRNDDGSPTSRQSKVHVLRAAAKRAAGAAGRSVCDRGDGVRL
jgi:hypothetical protein